MRTLSITCLLLLSLIATTAFCYAAVVDRVALVVGKTVFTQSEVDDEARLSELESGKPLDLSAAQRKAAAERLVDQQLLRDEMKVTAFQPPANEADALLLRFRQEHFASAALYHAALAKYGVTEGTLTQHLLWEVALIRFTDQRFKPFAAASQTGGQSADDTVDKEMAEWLKEQRAETRIMFKQEAFQ
jgi:hypothetical protein